MQTLRFTKIPTNKKSLMRVIYAINIFLTLHIAINIYVNSSFLTTLTTEDLVGVIYTIGSFLTILAILTTTKALEKFGNYKTSILLIILEILSLLGLVIFQSFALILPLFLIHFILSTILFLNIDIFLENYSIDKKTGTIRGIVLAINNIAWIAAPVISGYLLSNGEYWKIYTASIIFVIPVLLLLGINLKNFKDPKYDKIKFFVTLKKFYKNKNIYGIFMSNLVLRFFFALMVIYTPIYLNKHIGFGFGSIGIMMSVMLFAYLILELPLGRLADKKTGEKEILITGFLVLAVTTASLSFITSINLIVWIIALFATRIGAAMIEIMCETYFFKKIDATDTDMLSFYRMTRPISYMIAPIFATIFLLFFDMQYIFLAVGIIILLSIKYPLSIKDTK